jgi:drug/metabolite transporter (DMT)-like permease
MTALLGGIGAACFWAIAMLSSARASRTVGPWPVLAWVSLVGFVLVVPFAIWAASPPTETIGWLVLAGAGNVAGLLFEYIAVRSGMVGVVAAIASTEGAVAAVLAALLGEPTSGITALVLGLIAIGVVLAALGERQADADARAARRAVLFSMAAAAAFGAGLYAAGRVSGEVPLAWVVLPARFVGVVVIAAPLSLRGGIRIGRTVAPLVTMAALAEVGGIASFALGARDSIGVTSVLGSQFAAFAAVGGFVVFRERLRGLQIAGVVTILVGVTALAAMRAGA